MFFSEFGILHSFTLENSFFKKSKESKKDEEENANKKSKEGSAKKKWVNTKPRETPKRGCESVMKPYSNKLIPDKEPSPYEIDVIAEDKRKAPFQVFLDVYNLDKSTTLTKPKISQKMRDQALLPDNKLMNMMMDLTIDSPDI